MLMCHGGYSASGYLNDCCRICFENDPLYNAVHVVATEHVAVMFDNT